MRPFISGDEKKLDDCPIRMNGQLYGYDYQCNWDDKYIFIHCGERNLDRSMEYWGGIRYKIQKYQVNIVSVVIIIMHFSSGSVFQILNNIYLKIGCTMLSHTIHLKRKKVSWNL